MYKKILYNITKIKKCGGGRGRGPTTSGLEKRALLSTRLNTIIGITKYE